MFNRGSTATTARCSLLLRPLPNLFPPPSHVHLVAAYKHIITFDHRSHHILPTSRTPVIIVYTSRLPSQKKKVGHCDRDTSVFFVRVMEEVVEACRRATSTRAKGASYTASSIMLTARVLEVACEVDARRGGASLIMVCHEASPRCGCIMMRAWLIESILTCAEAILREAFLRGRMIHFGWRTSCPPICKHSHKRIQKLNMAQG